MKRPILLAAMLSGVFACAGETDEPVQKDEQQSVTTPPSREKPSRNIVHTQYDSDDGERRQSWSPIDGPPDEKRVESHRLPE